MGDVRWGANVFKYYGAPSGYAQREPLPYNWGYYDYDYNYNYLKSGGQGVKPAPGAEDPYKKLFDPKTIRTISGRVIKIDQVPEFGHALQMRLTVFIGKKRYCRFISGPPTTL